ncbi:MAG: alternative ribosome rescue aminoacyl-tRNA hydrolase ArfB [Ilumatobacteraceae bacterium]
MTSRADDHVMVTRSVRVPRSELRVSFGPSGGPGGQHANRSNTRVELRFDVASSAAFSEAQRARVIERLGPEVRVVVDDERSQLRNRALAEERLVTRLRSALHVDAPRRPTGPTKGSQRRRMDAKSRRGEVKRSRQRPTADG